VEGKDLVLHVEVFDAGEQCERYDHARCLLSAARQGEEQ
jgi:hypothetical protein